MPLIDQLLALGQSVARKSRQLIPNSENRNLVAPGVSGWTAPELRPSHLDLLLKAMRARKSDAAEQRNEVVAWFKEMGYIPRIADRDQHANYDDLVGIVVGFLDRGEPQVIFNEIKTTLAKHARNKKTRHKDNSPYAPIEQRESDAKNAVRYGIGNCGECASLAFLMLMEYGGPGDSANFPPLANNPDDRPWIEVVAVTEVGDHAFVIINRNIADNIKDLNWLNSGEVILCDPWWFHTGDACVCNAMTSVESAALKDYIEHGRQGLKVVNQKRLGSGHSSRFGSKHSSVNFWSDSVSSSKTKVGAKFASFPPDL